MDALAKALLDSWDRQVTILSNFAEIVDETNRSAKAAEDSWPIDFQLCHIHETRYWWLKQCSPGRAAALGDGFDESGEKPVPWQDLAKIRGLLGESAKAMRDTMEEALESGAQTLGCYEHPVLFLQHMVWHEGYHFGLMITALRNIGQEPNDEWQEKNIWEHWRGVEVWP